MRKMTVVIVVRHGNYSKNYFMPVGHLTLTRRPTRGARDSGWSVVWLLEILVCMVRRPVWHYRYIVLRMSHVSADVPK